MSVLFFFSETLKVLYTWAMENCNNTRTQKRQLLPSYQEQNEDKVIDFSLIFSYLCTSLSVQSFLFVLILVDLLHQN